MVVWERTINNVFLLFFSLHFPANFCLDNRPFPAIHLFAHSIYVVNTVTAATSSFLSPDTSTYFSPDAVHVLALLLLEKSLLE